MYVFLVFTALCGKTFAIDSVLECIEGEHTAINITLIKQLQVGS